MILIINKWDYDTKVLLSFEFHDVNNKNCTFGIPYISYEYDLLYTRVFYIFHLILVLIF